MTAREVAAQLAMWDRYEKQADLAMLKALEVASRGRSSARWSCPHPINAVVPAASDPFVVPKRCLVCGSMWTAWTITPGPAEDWDIKPEEVVDAR